jgi:hypothetical protein
MNKDLMNIDYLQSIQQDVVYVLAPGPNGIDYWDEIPEDAFVIVVNKAIELIHDRSIQCSSCLWLISENSAFQTEWFQTYKDAYSGILCVGKALVGPGNLKDDEYYKVFDYHGRVAVEQIIDVVPDALSIGTTVSGMAIQLAWHIGANKIVLCGIDMGGDYFDGTERIGGTAFGMYCEHMDRLMKRMKDKRDVEIVSLSPTRLNVEIINEECITT